MLLRGKWAATPDGYTVLAAEPWPGGPVVMMGYRALAPGMLSCRVSMDGVLPVSTQALSEQSARAWCLRTADVVLRELGGPVLDQAWRLQRSEGPVWRVELTGYPALVLEVSRRGDTWLGLVERPDSLETAERPDWPEMRDAMAWCERTAAAYRGRSGEQS